MKFNDELNNYIKILDCSSKKLANASDLSSATISRYRNTDRIPLHSSSHLDQLSTGIAKLAKEKNLSDITKDNVLKNFISTLSNNFFNFDQLRKNFNILIETLNINIAAMARGLNFDPSYFSRIRTGKRTPANPELFIDSICNFIAHKYNSQESKNSVSLLLNCSIEDISVEPIYAERLKSWLTQSPAKINNNEINNFLKKLDDFNLNEYIKVIHFDDLKVPNIPFYKSISKTYYGIEKMKQGELDFFKSTVLSKSTEDVFMYSNMPMEDMAKDVEFGKKWMFAIAMTIKKGLHLNVIHNINRPFNELMLGLESWIPIYMTGQVSPYYFKNSKNNIYCHLDYVSGKVALSGECVNGFHNNGKYHITSNSDDMKYYKDKSNLLLKKADSLMDIYTVSNKNEFNTFLLNNSKINGNRKRFLASLPIHTVSEELLFKILKRHNLSEKEINEILNNIKKQKSLMDNILKNNCVNDELPELSEDDFNNSKVNLSLSNTFFDKSVSYNYNEYLEHLALTKEYSKQNINYNFELNSRNIFSNIQITIQTDNCVIISKNTNPSIHFVIRHPKLRNAIENFIAPIIEKDIHS